MLTTAQAADILGVSAERVRQLVRTGELAAEMTPYGRLYARSDVEALRERRRKHSPPADKAVRGPEAAK